MCGGDRLRCNRPPIAWTSGKGVEWLADQVGTCRGQRFRMVKEIAHFVLIDTLGAPMDMGGARQPNRADRDVIIGPAIHQ